jgi:hypothetical protein
LDALLRATLGGLLLLLWLDLCNVANQTHIQSLTAFLSSYLGSLRLDLSGTGERAVHLTHDCGWVVV